MMTTRLAAALALPVLSAGILASAAIGLAGSANADTGGAPTVTISDNGSTVTVCNHNHPDFAITDDSDSTDGSALRSPTLLANPAPNYVPWASAINEGNASQDMYAAIVGTDANP
jgi:hypothetical protein